MDDRDREKERLQEVRQRARELKERDDEGRSATREREIPRDSRKGSAKGEMKTSRGTAVSSWRPLRRGRPLEQRDVSRDQHGSGFMGYPGSAGYPFYMGYPGAAAYPPILGGYPGYAGMPTPVGLPFEAGRPGQRLADEPFRREERQSERDARQEWTPRMRLFERAGELIARFELPGIDPKNVEVHVVEQRLVVEGERGDDRPQEPGAYRGAWGYGPFRREVDLPYPVDPDDLKATFRNGILDVAIPHKQREERRKFVKIET